MLSRSCKNCLYDYFLIKVKMNRCLSECCCAYEHAILGVVKVPPNFRHKVPTSRFFPDDVVCLELRKSTRRKLQTSPSSSFHWHLTRVCVCCLVEPIAPCRISSQTGGDIGFLLAAFVRLCIQVWTEMTAPPLCLERDLALAALPLHCLWSHSGLLGRLLIVCVFETER